MQTDTILNTESFDLHARQALVLSLFDSLNSGSAFLVQLGSHPDELCRQLDRLEQPELRWELVDKTPGRWKLRITKIKKEQLKNSDSCCGMCGG